MASVTGILESSIYVEDLARAAAFYKELFEFPVLFQDDRACAFDVAGRSIFLIFLKGRSNRPNVVANGAGLVPPHDAGGRIHFAFSITADQLGAWTERLNERSIRIESRVDWQRGGVSLYFRDPEGNLVELITPGVWATY